MTWKRIPTVCFQSLSSAPRSILALWYESSFSLFSSVIRSCRPITRSFSCTKPTVRATLSSASWISRLVSEASYTRLGRRAAPATFDATEVRTLSPAARSHCSATARSASPASYTLSLRTMSSLFPLRIATNPGVWLPFARSRNPARRMSARAVEIDEALGGFLVPGGGRLDHLLPFRVGEREGDLGGGLLEPEGVLPGMRVEPAAVGLGSLLQIPENHRDRIDFVPAHLLAAVEDRRNGSCRLEPLFFVLRGVFEDGKREGGDQILVGPDRAEAVIVLDRLGMRKHQRDQDHQDDADRDLDGEAVVRAPGLKHRRDALESRSMFRFRFHRFFTNMSRS